MSVIKLYEVIEGGELSPQDCIDINQSLSKLSPEQIPSNQKDNVRDYLTQSLNMNSVEPELIGSLEALLGGL